ncbi:MAG: SEL1-like repeat protein, partial [Treponema sp.]|nr:SEL1-like repeat protein [Treponema sp.]
YVVGVLYENGQGVAQDNKKAFEWYSKAAEQGYSDAAKALEELKNQ